MRKITTSGRTSFSSLPGCRTSKNILQPCSMKGNTIQAHDDCVRVAVFGELLTYEVLCASRARSGSDPETFLQTGWIPNPHFNTEINAKLYRLPQATNYNKHFSGNNITLFRGMSIEEARVIIDGRVEESGIHYTNVRRVAIMYAQIRNGLICEITIPKEDVKFYINSRHHEFIISAYSLKQCRPLFYEITNQHCRSITYSEIRAIAEK